MFEALSDRLATALRRFSGRGRLTKEDVEVGLREVRVALLEADVNFRVARAFVDRIRERAIGSDVLESLTPGQQIVKIVNDELVALLGGDQRKIQYQPHPPTVIMLVGLQGSGKTTTAAKLGVAIRRDGHRPMLVAADITRPAAVQQLQKLGLDNQIPVTVPDGKARVAQLAARGVAEATRLNCDVVIIDTAGRLQIDEPLLDELRDIRKATTVHEVILAVDAMTGQEAVNVAKGFDDAVHVDGVILTKLDGDARGGAALSMRETIGKPIMYVGTGEKVSDLEAFAPDRMASRILGMGDVLTLVERAQEQFDQKNAEEMVERSFAGRLTMDDWLAQLRQLRGMGSLEGVLGMLPGGRKLVQQAGAAMPSEQDLGRMEAIVLSMTAQERRHPEIIKGARRKRIASGSGTTIADVNRLLKGFEQMQSMFKSLGGKGTKGVRGKARMLRQLKNIDPTQLGQAGF
ncbi:MAG: signal recognition particle protein [Candidatus Dormibacteria bacterium]